MCVDVYFDSVKHKRFIPDRKIYGYSKELNVSIYHLIGFFHIFFIRQIENIKYSFQ